MRISVTYRPDDAGHGGRLEADLRRRLPGDSVSGNSDGPADAIVVLLGATWQRQLPAGLTRILASGARVIPVVLREEDAPSLDALPEDLRPLAAEPPVLATHEYWDEMIDRVVARIADTRDRTLRARLTAAVRRRPRVSVATAVGVVSGIVGTLAVFGVFDPPEALSGELKIDGQRADVTMAEYQLDGVPPGWTPPPGAAPDDAGFVYRVRVGSLAGADGRRPMLQWTVEDADAQDPIEALEDVRAARFDGAAVSGVHRLWVPCPATDALPFVVAFELVDEAAPKTAPPVDTVTSAPEECRVLEDG